MATIKTSLIELDELQSLFSDDELQALFAEIERSGEKALAALVALDFDEVKIDISHFSLLDGTVNHNGSPRQRRKSRKKAPPVKKVKNEHGEALGLTADACRSVKYRRKTEQTAP